MYVHVISQPASIKALVKLWAGGWEFATLAVAAITYYYYFYPIRTLDVVLELFLLFV